MNVNEEIRWGTSAPIRVKIYKCTSDKNEIITMEQPLMVNITTFGYYSYEVIDNTKNSNSNEIKETLLYVIDKYANEKAKEQMTIEEIEKNLKEKEDFLATLNKELQDKNGVKFTHFTVDKFEILESEKIEGFCKAKEEKEEVTTTPVTIENSNPPVAEKSNFSLLTIIGIVVVVIALIIIIKSIFVKKKPEINNENININNQNNFNNQDNTNNMNNYNDHNNQF